MDIELIAVGTELLLGHTVDTNGAEIARVLGALGVRVVRRTAVADGGEEIRDAVAGALRRSGAVITTGGLGPTSDDVTREAVAELFGAPLDFDPGVWNALVQRFARLGRVPVESNRVQAQVPRGAVVLPNRWGTAPGLWLEGRPGLVVMLPGVPYEMRNLLRHEVAPRFAQRGSGRVVRSLTVRTTGIPESTLGERVADVARSAAPLTLAFLPGVEGVDLRLTAWDLPPGEADRRLRAAADLLTARTAPHAYGEDDADLAAVVLEHARARRLRIAVAESCTGGLVGGRLTDTPGSSDVFVGGVIAYANEVKVSLLGVAPELIERHGAVSGEVARAMALGAARATGAELALAVTGIAGPGGGTPAKPVGTVWLAVALGDEVEGARVLMAGSRPEVRARAAQAALFRALLRLRGVPAG